MSHPVLIIISGAPAAGKTTLGRRLSADLGLPFVAKDDIKETLFDSLGWKDREWSRKLGRATYELLYYFTEMQLLAGQSFVVESNFRPEYSTAKFLELQQTHGFVPIQILCRAEDEVLRERYRRRARSGERHPGHVDHVLYEEMESGSPPAGYDPLPLEGSVLAVDTTELATVDYAAILNEVRALIERRGAC